MDAETEVPLLTLQITVCRNCVERVPGECQVMVLESDGSVSPLRRLVRSLRAAGLLNEGEEDR